jgi:hypothetical protein
MNRRTILALSAAAVAVSCAGLTPSQASADVATLAAGVKNLDFAVSAVPGVPASVVGKIATEDAIIQADASQVASALVPSSSLVIEINNAVGLISTLATPFFPAAPAIAAVVTAATALGQFIVQDVTGKVGAAPTGMTRKQARKILKAGIIDKLLKAESL